MTKYTAINPIGKVSTVDNEFSGYWTTFRDEARGGRWVRTDGGDNGFWIYDDYEESTAFGTWINTSLTSNGIW